MRGALGPSCFISQRFGFIVLPLSAVVEFQTPKRVWIWRPLAQYYQFDKEKEALRPQNADLSPAGSK